MYDAAVPGFATTTEAGAIVRVGVARTVGATAAIRNNRVSVRSRLEYFNMQPTRRSTSF